MTNYDHIHDDNVVPLFEHILLRRRDASHARSRFNGLRAKLWHACGLAFSLRKTG